VRSSPKPSDQWPHEELQEPRRTEPDFTIKHSAIIVGLLILVLILGSFLLFGFCLVSLTPRINVLPM
jgi:hypothetical protein